MPKESTREVRVAGVRLSHPDRILYPEQGVSKRDLAAYYERIAGHILPHVRDRPLTLLRCPEGRHKSCFFQKHVTEGAPASLGSVEIEEKGGRKRPYFVVRDTAGLVGLVQMGVLEIHVWGARIDRLERPDLLVFDVDPGADLSWSRVVEAAVHVRDRLRDLELASWVKTTGGKGLHVVVPLVRRSGWDRTSAFARALAERIARDDPETYTARAGKEHRKGKVFIDYLRNTRGATFVAAYSPRARPGAPVSVPVPWSELERQTRPEAHDIVDLPRRLARTKRDPWQGFWRARQSVTRSAARRLGVG